jgi:hypothetical protein
MMALQVDPDSVKALYLRGQAYMSDVEMPNNYEMAAADFKEAIEKQNAVIKKLDA